MPYEGYECVITSIEKNKVFYTANLLEKVVPIKVPIRYSVVDEYNKSNPKNPLNLKIGEQESNVHVRILHRPHKTLQVTDILRVGV
jgi:hypothetical protein